MNGPGRDEAVIERLFRVGSSVRDVVLEIGIADGFAGVSDDSVEFQRFERDSVDTGSEYDPDPQPISERQTNAVMMYCDLILIYDLAGTNHWNC